MADGILGTSLPSSSNSSSWMTLVRTTFRSYRRVLSSQLSALTCGSMTGVFRDLRIFGESGFLDDVDGFRLLDGWDVFRFLTRLG
jgi:hypothetical protein